MDFTPDETLPVEGFQPQPHDFELADQAADSFDHDRLISLVDGLERDIALIEGAMVHVEAREFASANAALDVLDGVSTA